MEEATGIKEIRAKDFRGLAETRADGFTGINLFIGPPGSGKSSHGGEKHLMMPLRLD